MSNANHPAHYNTGRIEVIEFLEDQQLPPHEWNAVKYISRAGRKDPDKRIEDLEKAVWYLNRKLELLRAEKEGREAKRPNDMNPRKKEEEPSEKKLENLCTNCGKNLHRDPDRCQIISDVGIAIPLCLGCFKSHTNWKKSHGAERFNGA